MSMKAGDTSARRRRRRCSELSRARVECELASQLHMCEPRESEIGECVNLSFEIRQGQSSIFTLADRDGRSHAVSP